MRRLLLPYQADDGLCRVLTHVGQGVGGHEHRCVPGKKAGHRCRELVVGEVADVPQGDLGQGPDGKGEIAGNFSSAKCCVEEFSVRLRDALAVSAMGHCQSLSVSNSLGLLTAKSGPYVSPLFLEL